jgi:hypothetical protein
MSFFNAQLQMLAAVAGDLAATGSGLGARTAAAEISAPTAARFAAHAGPNQADRAGGGDRVCPTSWPSSFTE